MRELTDAECELISKSEYTVDWSSTLDEGDSNCRLDDEFEDYFDVLVEGKYDQREDIGGITVYMKDDKLVAYYDYEWRVGTIF